MLKILGGLFKAIREDARKDIDKKLHNLLYEGREYNDHILLQTPEEVALLFNKYPFILGYFFNPEQVDDIAGELPFNHASRISFRVEWQDLSLEWRKQAYIGYFCPPKDYDRFTLIDCQTLLFKLLFKLALDEAIQSGIITKEDATKPEIYEQAKTLVHGVSD